jgi:predicted unusual protein kinase regulating ubiquinone biosynthesis (AarF/ABC1/UbiB family)
MITLCQNTSDTNSRLSSPTPSCRFGQAASTRPDVVGPIYRSELVKLVDAVPPFSGEEAEAIVMEELSIGSLGDAFASFDLAPIASASLGQVHRATLLTGEHVAVKVQRPGIAEQASLDLYILRKAASLLKTRFKLRSDLPGIVAEFGQTLFLELDYVHEADYCEEFSALYVSPGPSSVPGVYAPRIFRAQSGTRVLCMEWIDGEKPPWTPEKEAARLLAVGVRCSLTQLLVGGLTHSDLHSGNILRDRNTGKLVYLDFGMCTRVTRETSVDLIRSIANLVNRNYAGLAADFARLGFLPPGTDTSPLVPKLEQAFADARSGGMSELSFSKLTGSLASLAATSPIEIPVAFTTLIRNLAILEGLALESSPSFKIVGAAYPFVVNRLLVDDDPILQEVLKDVLIEPSTGRLRWNRFDSILTASEQSVTGRSAMETMPSSPASPNNGLSSQTINRFVSFALSDRGEFLRDVLTVEVAEMLDAAQLNLAARVSAASGGFLPAPSEKADPDQLRRLQSLVKRGPSLLRASTSTVSGGGGDNDDGPYMEGRGERRFSLLSAFVKAGWTATGRILDRNARRKIRVLGNYAADAIIGPRVDKR